MNYTCSILDDVPVAQCLLKSRGFSYSKQQIPSSMKEAKTRVLQVAHVELLLKQIVAQFKK